MGSSEGNIRQKYSIWPGSSVVMHDTVAYEMFSGESD